MDHFPEELYREMLMKLADYERSEGICVFAALKGGNYGGELLVIGRAVNGWLVNLAPSDLNDKKKLDEAITALADGTDMCWVTKRWGARHGYNTKRSAFWRTARAVVGELGVADIKDNSWPSYISWSNLYKLARRDGGNPPSELIKLQFESCVKILEAEIYSLKPRRILLLTSKGWATPFLDKIGFTKQSSLDEPPCVFGSLPNGSKVAVLEHPQGKREGPMVAAAVNYLKNV